MLRAQAATYELGPLGSSAVCMAQNDPVPGFVAHSLTNEYAYAVRPTQAITVAAFSLYTETRTGAPATIRTGIYLDAGTGVPDLNAVATGTMTVDGPLGWYSTVIDPPVQIPANTLFFLGADTNAVRPADAGSAGVTPPAPSYWRRPPFGGTGWAVSGTIDSPIYRLHCLMPGGGIATMTGISPPALGGTLVLGLHGVSPGIPSFMAIGFSKTQWGSLTLPFALDNFGLQGNLLLVSLDVMTAVTPSSTTPQRFTLPIPAMPSLTNLAFHNQAFVLNPGATAVGLLATNSGTGTIR